MDTIKNEKSNPVANYKSPAGEVERDSNVLTADNSQSKYVLRETGVYFSDSPGSNQKICGWLRVIAETREISSGTEGVVVEFKNKRGEILKEFLSRKEIHEPGTKLLTKLASKGLEICTDGYKPLYNLTALSRYLRYALSKKKYPIRKMLNSGGWVDDSFQTFLFLNKSIGSKVSSEVILVPEASAMKNEAKGSLKGWKKALSRIASHSTRISFAVAASLASPLVPIFNEENRLFHFFGKSGDGKSTLLKVAASLWGGPKYKIDCNSTRNAIQHEFALRNHLPVIADELHLLDQSGKENIGYAFGEGQGRIRLNKDYKREEIRTWRCFSLMAGELSLSEEKSRTFRGSQAHALEGEAIRFLSIPSSAGEYGVFESFPPELMSEKSEDLSMAQSALEGVQSGSLFKARRRFVQEITNDFERKQYGIAGPLFIKKVAEQIKADGLDKFREEGERFMREFDAKATTQSRSQTRVLKSFSLVAFAGELAVSYGVLPWESGVVTDVVLKIFEAWKASEETPESRKNAVVRAIREHPQVSKTYEIHDETLSRQTSSCGLESSGVVIKTKEGILCTIYTTSQFQRLLYEEGGGFSRQEVIETLLKRKLLLVNGGQATSHRHQFRINSAIPLLGLGPAWYIFLLNCVKSDDTDGFMTQSEAIEKVKSLLKHS